MVFVVVDQGTIHDDSCVATVVCFYLIQIQHCPPIWSLNISSDGAIIGRMLQLNLGNGFQEHADTHS